VDDADSDWLSAWRRLGLAKVTAPDANDARRKNSLRRMILPANVLLGTQQPG
jgi:hypothetical protein